MVKRRGAARAGAAIGRAAPAALAAVTALTALAGLVALATGCAGDLDIPEIGEPYFYLVLQPGKVWSSTDPGAHFALAFTIVTPGDLRCRAVDGLDMRRASDDTPFDWTTGACTAILGPSIPSDACCTLPVSSTDPTALGAGELAYGETYDLVVQTEGVTIQGSTRIPAAFQVRVMDDGAGGRLLVWPRVEGAAGYEVDLGTDPIRQSYQDTTYVLPAGTHGIAKVRALDANLWTFIANSTATRAGLDTGLGVFGAVSETGGVAY